MLKNIYMTLYRILSFLVTIFCSLIAMILFFGIFMALSNPAVWFQCFLLAGVVLYGWFSNRFHATVLIAKKQMSKRQKDLLQVNAIVAFIFSIFSLAGCSVIFADSAQVNEMLKQVPPEANLTAQTLYDIAYVLIVFCLALLAHIIWTYLLIRKNKDLFEA